MLDPRTKDAIRETSSKLTVIMEILKSNKESLDYLKKNMRDIRTSIIRKKSK